MKGLLALASAFLLFDGGLTPEEFQKLHAQLKPRRDELWRSIPWKTSLLEARDLAVRERKPLFMWSMNGSPLGCG
jgi:hypothetical protein